MSVTTSAGLTVQVPVDGSALAAGQPVTVGVRPADVEPGKDGDSVVEARVQSVEQLGDVSYLYAKLTTDELVIAKGTTGSGRGEAIPLSFDARACHVFDDGGRALPRIASGADAPLERAQ